MNGPSASVRPSSRRPSMIPTRVRRVIEDLLPWYDRAAEARHDERTRYIHERSIAIRQEVERRIELSHSKGAERIRSAYRAYGNGLDR